MNRAEVIRQIFLWDRVAAQAKARAGRFRAMLQAEANAEFEEQGTAPTWRLPEIASVVLPVTHTSAVVRDEKALAKWVSVRRPDEVEMRVRSSYVEALRKGARIEGDVVMDKEGTVIPGMAVEPGGVPRSVTLTPEAGAKVVATEAADRVLDAVAASLDLPPVPEPAEAEVPDAQD